jgi:NTE family protein
MSSYFPKVALVLGGGGIRPFSAIPLFSFLENHGIPIDLLVGCSGGSMMVSGWASGITTDQMIKEIIPRVEKSLFKLNWRSMLSVRNFPFGKINKESGLLDSFPIRKLFKELWKELRLEELKIKTILQTTDFQTGEGIGLENGNLADAVYASSAIFPILPAARIGSRWLFDGAYSAPVPILQAVNHKADIIIVVDFQDPIDSDPKGFFDSLMHVSRMDSKAIVASHMALSIDIMSSEIIYMKVNFRKNISFYEVEQLPYIIETGEQALEKIKDEFFNLYKLKCDQNQSIFQSKHL